MIYHDFQDLKLSALGFGTMRLPLNPDKSIDVEQVFEMTDYAKTGSAVETKTVKLGVSKGTTATVKKSSSDLQIKGASSFTIKSQKGNEGTDGAITYTSSSSVKAQKTDSSKAYKITESNGKSAIKVGSSLNGSFTTDLRKKPSVYPCLTPSLIASSRMPPSKCTS